MSLTDLKRNLVKKKPSKVSIEDFIDDATNYAAGKPSKLEVSDNSSAQSTTQAKTAEKPVKQFRHATFTLTEQSISQLDELSQQTGMAKSKLLRIFIANFSQLSDDEQAGLLALCEQANEQG
ncbi:replication protein RepA [Shewanella avicenniae]|uniref:Replication protein RepA n=1 Tax=Shewanella avicenniae TaxID=2814294 RepID=A0ABX7QV59_9GAMM|nr:replication protein RepA [Shewanella avicenniae]QSX34870.1 replication protein RepA [Shewanella avicenniae]